jgi:hypothetical protein
MASKLWDPMCSNFGSPSRVLAILVQLSGTKHDKLDQKVHLPNILFKNMTFFYKNTRK